MKAFLTNIITHIVDKPDEIKINVVESDSTQIYELSVGEGDMGKVIGKRCKNITSIRTLFSAVSAKYGGKRSIIEIIE
jgi:predicted RNA-binding protein YlqC (UPF0109 family)